LKEVSPDQNKSNRRLLMQYAGLAAELLAGIGLAVLAGYYADKAIGFPLLVWLLPLLVVIATIMKAVKDTGKK
jgi:hypothetical protein